MPGFFLLEFLKGGENFKTFSKLGGKGGSWVQSRLLPIGPPGHSPALTRPPRLPAATEA